MKTKHNAMTAALLISRNIERNEENMKKSESALIKQFLQLNIKKKGTTVLIRIEKEDILTFAPNPAKALDLSRRLPFIITESITLRLIRTDSKNKLKSVAMIK